MTFRYDDGLRSYETTKTFEGVVRNLERRLKETESDWAREEIGRFMSETPCAACNGFRLKPEALAHAMAARRQPGEFRLHQGYDHSYFFVQTFMADHIRWHAERLA